MQKSTKEIIIARRSELSQLLNEAFEHHDLCEGARASVESGKKLALYHAWQTGIRLNKMKALVGFGDWMDWVELNFCKPHKVSHETAVLYMRIDTQNEHLRDKANLQRVTNVEADLQIVTKFKFDTIRQYANQFVPHKPRPNHRGKNIKFPRLVHHLTLVNEYEKVRRQMETSDAPIDLDEVRRDFLPLYEWLKQFFKDAL